MLASDIPNKFPVPFANSAGGSYIRTVPTTTTDPNAASLTLGFPPNTFVPEGAGGDPPDGRDFNGLLNQMSAWERWFSAGGPIAYDATFQTAIGGYPSGAIVASATAAGLYWRSTADNNATNPDTGGAGWVTFPNATASGGNVNKFRNATMLVATRGTSGTVSAGTSAYTLDGHYLSATGAGLVWSQVAGIGYGPKALALNCASGLTDAKWAQPIESQEAAPLAGQIVVFQMAVKNNSGSSLTPSLTVKHLNVSDAGAAAPWTGTPAASTTDINAQALQACPNGATTVVTWVFTASASLGNGALIQLDFGAALNAASGSVTLGDPDIRILPYGVGGAANFPPPIPEMRTITEEQGQCGRYLPTFTVGNGAHGPMGLIKTGTNAVFPFRFRQSARVKVTGILAAFGFTIDYGSATAAGGATVFVDGDTDGALVGATFSGLPNPLAAILVGSPSVPVFTGAEL